MKTGKTGYRKVSALFVTMLLFAALLAFSGSAMAAETEAAGTAAETKKTTVKDGLAKVEWKGTFYDTQGKKISKAYRYVYYENGKKVKNAWRTVNVKGTSYRYYFKKNGYAVQASYADNDLDRKFKYVTVKIDGKKYAFDTNGRMLTGLLLQSNDKFIYFNKKTGVYDSKKSASITKKFKNLKSSVKKDLDNGKKTKSVPSDVKKILGKYNKLYINSGVASCNSAYWDTGSGNLRDVELRYDHFIIILVKQKKTQNYFIDKAIAQLS